jgi:RNA polymerase sigma-70 factor, ECF subfamily
VTVVGALRKLDDVSVLAESLEPADEEAAADAFLADAQGYRRELLAHCYRMTGSLHDAEDLVQETYLRAWKSYKGFQGKSSVRTWLYRIATNTSLTALQNRQRRPLPTGLGQPSADPAGELTERAEVPWLEPLPDVHEDPSDPSTIVGSRESVRLAFIAALQHLSPRQRAVLVMRDVLQWKAAEVGDAIGASTAAVNSLLQRARAQLDAVGPSQDDALEPPESPEAKDLLDRYIAAFESYDIDKLVEMFTEEAVWEMPPFDGWFKGREAVVTLNRVHCPAEGPGDMRFIALTANGQPAAALYMLNKETGVHEAFQLHVLDIGSDGISHVVAFLDIALFEKFGLPSTLPSGAERPLMPRDHSKFAR